MSLPLRERGLKFVASNKLCAQTFVAPLAGAWIEILKLVILYNHNKVAPLAGAWIEIQNTKIIDKPIAVAPLAGAWIEIY